MPADLRSQLKAVAPRLRDAQAKTREAAQERSRQARAAALHAEQAEHERTLFAQATRDVKPLTPPNRVEAPRPLRPLTPAMHRLDEASALAASLSDGIDADALLDSDEGLSFAREGIAPNTLRKLRRGDWVIQAQLDLHGMTRDEAREALAAFLHTALKHGLRCVRIVHGKGLGSKNRAPVLKDKVRHWLMQSDRVLAFVQARAADGGAGAVLALLKNT